MGAEPVDVGGAPCCRLSRMSAMTVAPSSTLTLANLVTDWGGFERLVARMHDTGDVEVEHNMQLPAKSGGSYQIDVVVRSTREPYTYLTIIECKYWNHPVGRDIINALANVKDDVGAEKAVCFTTKGFQAGAKQVAAHRGIDLFLVKELVPEDWSSPGRIIDLRPSMRSLTGSQLERE